MLKPGLILLCPLLLSACASDQPLVAAPPIDNGCPRVVPCSLPPANPRSNEGLSQEIDQLEPGLARLRRPGRHDSGMPATAGAKGA
ncbi:Rz1-like lysis system protein LysC [Shewanella dokdonensis]|uniref:Rz1-like lysis system protein LysC n=1 Tax=Shewanella dokdonensis TaxID=712036 RepID=UPI003CC7CE6E